MATPEENVFPDRSQIPELDAPVGRIPTAGLDAPASVAPTPMPARLSKTLSFFRSKLDEGVSEEEILQGVSSRPELVELYGRFKQDGFFDAAARGQEPELVAPPLTATDSAFFELMGQEALPERGANAPPPVTDHIDGLPVVPNDEGSLLDRVDQTRDTFLEDVAFHGLNVNRAFNRGALSAATLPATISTLAAKAADEAALGLTGDLLATGAEPSLIGGRTLGRSGVLMGLLMGGPRMLEDFLSGEDDTPGMLEALGGLNPFQTIAGALSTPDVPEMFRVDPRPARRRVNPDGTSTFASTQDFIQGAGLNLAENFGAGALMLPAALATIPSNTLSLGAMSALELSSAVGGAAGRTIAQDQQFGPAGQFMAELFGSFAAAGGPAVARHVALSGAGILKAGFKRISSIGQKAKPRAEAVEILRRAGKTLGEDPGEISRILANPSDPRHAELIRAMMTPGQITQSSLLLGLEDDLMKQVPGFRAELMKADASLPAALHRYMNDAFGGGNSEEAMRLIRMSSEYNAMQLHNAMRRAAADVDNAVSSIMRLGENGVPDASTALTNITNKFERTMKAVRLNEKQLWDAIPTAVSKTKQVKAAHRALIQDRGVIFDESVNARMQSILDDLGPETSASRMLEIRNWFLDKAREQSLAGHNNQASVLGEMAESARLALVNDTVQRVLPGPGGGMIVSQSNFTNAYKAAADFTTLKHTIADNSVISKVLGISNNPNAVFNAVSAPGPTGAAAIKTVRSLNRIPASQQHPIAAVTMDEMSAIIQDKLMDAAGDPKRLNVNGIRRFMRHNAKGYGESLDALGLTGQAQDLLNQAIHQSKFRRIAGAQEKIINQSLAGQLALADNSPTVLKRTIGEFFTDNRGGQKLVSLKNSIQKMGRTGQATAEEVAGGLSGLRMATWDAVSDRFFTIGPEGMTIKAGASGDLADIRGVLERGKLFKKDELDLIEVVIDGLARKQGIKFTGITKDIGENTIAGHIASFGGAQLGGRIGASTTGGSLKAAQSGSRFSRWAAGLSGKQEIIDIFTEAFQPTEQGREALIALLADAGSPAAQQKALDLFADTGKAGFKLTGTQATTIGNLGLELSEDNE